MTYTASSDIRSVHLAPASGLFAVCVDEKIVITCTVSSTKVLAWALTDPANGSIPHHYAYTATTSLQYVRMLGDFDLRLHSNEPLVSTATLNNTDLKHNGTVLACANEVSYEDAVSITILVKGKLNACYNSIELHVMVA